MEKQQSKFDEIFEDIFEVLQNPNFLICEPFDFEREDEQRQEHRKDETLAQEGVGQKVPKRLKPAREHERIPEAIEAGREIAINRQAELVIHRPNGQIRDKDSYGNDPCPPRDSKH